MIFLFIFLFFVIFRYFLEICFIFDQWMYWGNINQIYDPKNEKWSSIIRTRSLWTWTLETNHLEHCLKGKSIIFESLQSIITIFSIWFRVFKQENQLNITLINGKLIHFQRFCLRKKSCSCWWWSCHWDSKWTLSILNNFRSFVLGGNIKKYNYRWREKVRFSLNVRVHYIHYNRVRDNVPGKYLIIPSVLFERQYGDYKCQTIFLFINITYDYSVSELEI